MAKFLELKFFKYFINNRKTFIKYFFLSFIVGLLELGGVALTYPFIKRILTNENIDKTTIIIAIAIIFAFLIKNIFMIFYNKIQADFVKNCSNTICLKFMHFFLFGDFQKTSKITFAKKLQILFFLVPNSINNYLLRILNLHVNLFIFALISLFLFIKFFTASVTTLICSLILLLGQQLFFKLKTKIISNSITKSNRELTQTTNETLLNLKNIKLIHAEEFFNNKYEKRLKLFQDHSKNLLFYNSIPPYITEPFIIMLLMILITIISIQNQENTTTLVASYAVIASAIFRLAPTLSRIQANLVGINNSIPQVKSLIEYYEDFSLNKSFNIKLKPIQNFEESIELKNVDFSYDEKPILKDISLKINKGDFIGIAGASGVGKSTLIDIIAGLQKINSGELYLDNIIVPNNELPSLKIGYIPQDYTVISASIRENIAFGTTDINDDKVIEALKKAQLYDFIKENFKEGIYSNPFIDNNGFSQGQKQRLAIARALYTDPDIIILDEATSSLDLKTESEICETLISLKGEKTIIAVAHRLSTIKNADKIIFMKDSTINQTGTFEELQQTNKDFKELVLLNNTDSVH